MTFTALQRCKSRFVKRSLMREIQMHLMDDLISNTFLRTSSRNNSTSHSNHLAPSNEQPGPIAQVQGSTHEKFKCRSSANPVVAGQTKPKTSGSPKVRATQNTKSSSEFRLKLEELFRNERVSDAKFLQFAKIWVPQGTVSDISELVRLAGKKSGTTTYTPLRCWLPALALRLTELSKERHRYLDIAFILYGLQCLTERDQGYLTILTLMSQKISQFLKGGTVEPFSARNVTMMLYGLQRNTAVAMESRHHISVLIQMIKGCTEPMNPQEISHSLYALKCMNSNNYDALYLLKALVPKAESCTGTLNPQDVGNAMFGLQGMSSNRGEVLMMLRALIPKMTNWKSELTAKQVGNTLYGLQSMKSDKVETLRLVEVLAPMIGSCQERLSSQTVSNALYGLKGMSSSQEEVRSLLRALVSLMRNCDQFLDAKAMSMSLYGLQNMSNDVDEVKQLLRALVPLVQGCSDPLDAQGVGNALYGLQCMSGDCPELQSLLNALVPKVEGCKVPLSTQEVSNALYGLQGLGGVDSIAPLLRFISSQPSIHTPLHRMERLDIVTLGQAIALIIPLIRGSLSAADAKCWDGVHLAVGRQMARLNSVKGTVRWRVQSAAELRMLDSARKVFESTDVTVSNNVHLFNLFEADIVLRVPCSSSGEHIKDSTLIINIEIDGVEKRRFCMLRDEYLKSKGVVVVRIPSAGLWKLQCEEIDKWILDSVSDSLVAASQSGTVQHLAGGQVDS